MDLSQKYELIKTVARSKRVIHDFPADVNLHMSETFGLCALLERDGNVTTAELQKDLHINKSAVSQMLTSLEQKGFITRTINTGDRRRIDIGITQKGYEATANLKHYLDMAVDTIFSRYGEEKAQQLVTLYDEFVDVFNEVHLELKSKLKLEDMA